MRRIRCLLGVTFLVFAAGAANAQMVAVAPLAETPVTVDGVMAAGEWDDANEYYFDATDNNTWPGWGLPNEIADPNNWSCTFYVKHDANNIYVCTVVTDDSVIDPPDSGANVWDDDTMELYFDCDNSNSATNDLSATGGFQISFRSDGTAGTWGPGYDTFWWATAVIGPPGIVTEFRIDKAQTGMATGGIYGYDMSPDEDDDGAGRENQIWWNAHVDAYNNEQPWGDIFLSPTTKAAPTQRVTGGLQVLYDFISLPGSVGNRVADVSGVGVPSHLSIRDLANTAWIPDGGLIINAETLISSLEPAGKVIAGCKASNAVTLEAWVKPSDVEQDGPSRIATVSDPTNGANNRNITLGQNYWAAHDQTPEPTYITRCRTTTTGNNGSPEIDSGNQSLNLDLAHVVFTHDAAGNDIMYLNGVQANTGTRTGDFSAWDDAYQFALANEFASAAGDRDWLGTFHLVAVYDRALSAAEVLQNYNAGPRPVAGGPPDAPSNLTATAISSQIISLSWTDNATNEAGFEIQRKEGAGGTYATIGTVGPNVTVYSDIGLNPETTYFYRVRAGNFQGDSAWSNEASATTPASSLDARNWCLYD